MRIIKIVLPNREVIRMEISGDEGEIKELLSTIVGIPATDIKGLKDKYGNHFTISFVSKNNCINSEFSEFYYLICSSRVSDPNTDIYRGNFPPSVVHSVDEFYDEREKEEEVYNRQISSYKGTPYNQYNKNVYSANVNQSANRFLRPETSSTNKKSGGNNQNRFRSSENLYNSQIPVKILEKNQVQFASVIKSLVDNKYLEGPRIGMLKNLIDESNEDVMRIINSYMSGFMTLGVMAENLLTIISINYYSPQEQENNIGIINKNLGTPQSSRTKTIDKASIYGIIEKIYTSYFDKGQVDLRLLRQLIELDNEFVKSAFELYQATGNTDKLVLSISQILHKYSTKKSEDLNEGLKVGEQRELAKTKPEKTEVHLAVLPGSSVKKFVSGELSTPGRIYFNESDISKISEKLQNDQKAIFKYAVLSKMKEIEVIYQMKINNFEEDTVIDAIKTFCNRFIEKNIIINFTKEEKEKYGELTLEGSEYLKEAFKDLPEHKNLALVSKELRIAIEKEMQSRKDDNQTIENNEEPAECETSESQDQEEQEDSNKIENQLIKTIKNQGWLKDQEKERLIEMIEADSEEGRKLMDEFHKQNNILALKTKIKKILKDDKSSKASKVTTKKTPDEILEILLKEKRLLKIQEYNSLKQFLKEKDPELLKLLNGYEAPENWEIISNSLNQFLNKAKHSKTPYSLSVGKKELIDMIKNQKHIEKGEIKKKQIHVIDTLLNEDMIDESSAKLVKQMIDAENQIIISAFEIFSVTKDHWEFCETIQLFTKIMKGNELAQENTAQPEAKTTITDYVPDIESYGIKQKEIQLLNTLIAEKSSKLLMSSLESYNQIKNVSELIENLRLVIKKANK